MTTKFIGMKDFRQNMTKYSELAKKKNIRYIILKKNCPIFEITPVSEDDLIYMQLKKQIDQAEKEIAEGKYYTMDQIKEMFGLK
jgi:hypothetical protein